MSSGCRAERTVNCRLLCTDVILSVVLQLVLLAVWLATTTAGAELLELVVGMVRGPEPGLHTVRAQAMGMGRSGVPAGRQAGARAGGRVRVLLTSLLNCSSSSAAVGMQWSLPVAVLGDAGHVGCRLLCASSSGASCSASV